MLLLILAGKFERKTCFALLSVAVFSCSKDINPKNIDFDVECVNNAGQPALSFAVGDTVGFKFSGNPDRISFFSGEKGYRYAYKDRVADTSTPTILSFMSALNTSGSGSTLNLLVSTDFTGYKQDATDAAAVTNANWTDISGRAVWAANATATSSGPVDLSDFAAQKKPVFLAFKYEALGGVAQAKWTLSGIAIRHYTADTSYLIDSTNLIIPASFPAWSVSSGWGTVNVQNPLVTFVLFSGATATTSAASTTGTTSFIITGSATASSAVDTENWFVAGPVDLQRVLPDAGIAIKDMSEDAREIRKGIYASANANYTYRFTRPGTYNAVFFASSDSKDGQNTITKTIQIAVH